MSAQALLYQQHVVDCRNNRENEGGAQGYGSRDPYPAQGPHLKEQDKKDGGDLAQGIRFSENTGTEVS
jgi:hypothetical protein